MPKGSDIVRRSSKWFDVAGPEAEGPAALQRYRDAQTAMMLPLLRILMAFGIAAISAFGVWDYFLAPEMIGQTMMIRALLCVIVAALLGATFTPLGRRYWPLAGFAMTIAGVAGIAWILAILPSGFAFGVSGLLYMTGATVVVTPSWRYALGNFIASVAIPNAIMVAIHAPAFVLINANFFLVSFSIIFGAIYYLAERQRRRNFELESALARARLEREAILRDLLPGEILDRMQRGERRIAERAEAATVAFVDIVGFTGLTADMDPARTVALLDEVFSCFDAEAAFRGVEKIKTLGDGYMLASGVAGLETGAQEVAGFALAARDTAAEIARDRKIDLQLRIGIASGPLIAGVIGTRRPQFDLWGTTVNRASRLEAAAESGEILIDEETRSRLGPSWKTSERGEIPLKGIGPVRAYRLTRR